jgi:uncharacterized protein YbbK (DUF523 family)
MSASDPLSLRIGVSSCLLGDEVRYDGGHKRQAFLIEELGPHVEWVRVCPEVEVGMGVPREPVDLVVRPEDSAAGGVSLRGRWSGRDWTREMGTYALARLGMLAFHDLSGYVLKSRSPSCGKEGVPVFPGLRAPGDSAEPIRTAPGLFAAALLRRFPDLPVEEESRLADPACRREFIGRVVDHHRRLLERRGLSRDDLAEVSRRHARLLESLECIV